MAEEPNLGTSPFAGSRGGSLRSSFNSVRAKFKVDSNAIRQMTSEFDRLDKKLKDINKTLDEMIKKSGKAAGSMSGITGGVTSGGATTSAYSAQNSTIAAMSPGAPGSPTPPGGFVNTMFGGKGGAAVAGASILSNVLGSTLGASRGRINDMYQYSISADRLGVLFQQTQGISQNQYANNMRRPLTNFRLGEGGTDALLALQAQTGIVAGNQARAVEALRTSSGFAYNSQQIGQMISSLGSAQVNNRMTIMTGMGLYGPGGRQNNTMDVVKNLVQVSGLNDERILKGAMQQGSVTRANLSAMGLPEDMQNMVIQYAQSNMEFRKKGGGGMYDPANREHQKLMGISDNFATQQEETTRVEGQRDENFYRRQADNYAQLEKNTQGLVRAFGALEDKLSGLIGKQVQVPNKHMGWLKAGLPLAGAVVGGIAGSIIPGAGTASGALIGSMIAGGIAQGIGDPVPGDTMIPTYGQPISMSSLSGRQDWQKLHPTMQQRLTRMFKENPNVGIGSGWRSSENQKQIFLSRYKRTDSPTGTFWDGSYWEHVSGAPAAPPGRSMHEIGLAIDLVGDLDWVQQNAHRFGLKTFANVPGVNEPWHVQPDDLPNTRAEYEAQGSPWGSDGQYNAQDSEKSASGAKASGQPYNPMADEHGMTGGNDTLKSYSGMSLSQAMETFKANNQLPMGTGSGAVNPLRAKAGAGSSKTAGGTAGKATTINGSDTGGALIAKLLAAEGIKGDDLRIMLAIAEAESGLNARAHNGTPPDDSYGLFQINMLGKMGEDRRRRYGLSSNDDLYDPATNVRIAADLYRGGGFQPWSVYTNGRYQNYLGNASTYASAAGVGDPVMPTRRSAGTTVVNGGHSITISPSITITGGSSWQNDLPVIAKEIGRLLEQEAGRILMRSE